MPELSAQGWSNRLASVFQMIHGTRMADMPLNHEALQVEVIGMQPWQNNWIGVLVTPWCMNLVMLPGENSGWQELRELEQHQHRFPSGVYEFTVGHEADLGYFQQCSLFSPMFEFSDQQNAVTVASTILIELMKAKNTEEAPVTASDIEGIWRGETNRESFLQEGEVRKPETTVQPSFHRRQHLSRRDLIRGKLYDEERPDAN